MIRNVCMEDISDGKMYTANDMVKADTNQCQGCFACCCGMGTSIVLDPLDVHKLTTYLNTSMERLLAGALELNVVDGIILPNLSMKGEKEACSFLNSEGRCSIHEARPGICRLFPLGRVYDNQTFYYFLQVKECEKNCTKVKVKKWLDIPDLKAYEEYINTWHYFLKELTQRMQEKHQDEFTKQVSMYVLQTFYLKPFLQGEDFYTQFYQRIRKAKEEL